MVGLLVAALALVLGPAAPASAHAVLLGSDPPAGSVLTGAPDAVVLTFSEPVRQITGRIQVIGPDGSRVDTGRPRFDGAVVTIPLVAGPQGTYLVSYRVVSADSHPVAGGYTYSVGVASAPPGQDAAADRIDPAVATAVSMAKYLGYAGLVLVVGAAMVLALLWPRRLPRAGAARVAWTGLGLVAVATLAGLWLQVPYTAGNGSALDPAVLGDVLGTTFGAVHLVRLGVLAAVAILLRPLLAGRAGPGDRVLLLVLGVVGLVTWPLAGHPAAATLPTVSVTVDVVHLAGAAVWLGGLVMLVGFLLRLADARELDAILPIWSRWATTAVAAVLLAGTAQALMEVGTPAALVDTTYGRLLLAKIGMLAVVLAGAAYARQVIRRRVPAGAAATGGDDAAGSAGGAPGGGSVRPVRRVVWFELTVTAVILAVSATLVQTTPARTAAANPDAGEAGYFSATATSSLYRLQIEVDPAKVGNNTVHLYAFTPDNRPLPVVEWKAAAALPDKGLEPVDVPLLPLTDNHATGEISLSAAGKWQFRFTLRTSDVDQATVTTTVPVG
jgi:copper transport protein